jgi:non-canonical poly(A) RNA polymerase PAPD5/7
LFIFIQIPIIKFTDKETNIKIDICCDIEGGIHAASFIREMQLSLPALRPLTLFLKYFLYCRLLNDTYTGGIGSFMLQMMIISHLQQSPYQHEPLNLGILLWSFFDLYGMKFNYQHLGIRVTDGGTYYRKEQKGWTNKERPYMLSIENPLDESKEK